jgi:hypothetical protein
VLALTDACLATKGNVLYAVGLLPPWRGRLFHQRYVPKQPKTRLLECPRRDRNWLATPTTSTTADLELVHRGLSKNLKKFNISPHFVVKFAFNYFIKYSFISGTISSICQLWHSALARLQLRLKGFHL